LIFVDGILAGNYDELRLRVKKIADQPIRVVVNTNHYQDHTGTNAKFLADGTPVRAQENVARNLMACHPAGDKISPLQFGLVEVQLLHFSNARTDGDTVVYFPNLKAVAVGDIYLPSPVPDYSAGGSLFGWGPVWSQVLKLDFDAAIPGSGPAISRSGPRSLQKQD